MASSDYLDNAATGSGETDDLFGDEVQHLRHLGHHTHPPFVEYPPRRIYRRAQGRRPAAQRMHDVAKRAQRVDCSRPAARGRFGWYLSYTLRAFWIACGGSLFAVEPRSFIWISAQV